MRSRCWGSFWDCDRRLFKVHVGVVRRRHRLTSITQLGMQYSTERRFYTCLEASNISNPTILSDCFCQDDLRKSSWYSVD
ncbi:MAG: hypothetical protein VKN72_09180 [Nostocales cyanobacterium 94392]|nr:hypothetical protein [Nostocales cyanobacterium 94392]